MVLPHALRKGFRFHDREPCLVYEAALFLWC
jgi:hypothetical protein